MYTKVTLVGRITKELELRTAQSGISMLNFSLACDRMRGTERVADFFNITAFNKQAENTAKFCTKGSLVLVEGTLQNRSYEVEGRKVTVTDIIANQILFLTPKGSNNDSIDAQKQIKAEEEYKEMSPSIDADDDLPF